MKIFEEMKSFSNKWSELVNLSGRLIKQMKLVKENVE